MKARASNRDIEAAASELARSVEGTVLRQVPLGSLTSLKVGGPAAILVEPVNESDLLSISSVVVQKKLPCLVLGRGTNVLISDEGFFGVVIRLGRSFEWIRGEGSIVEAGAATPLPQVANWAARRSLTGMEFAIAIPATVGGAVRMNAGAHRSDIADVLVSARVCHLTESRVETISKHSLSMTYRSTGMGGLDVVCSAQFGLAPGDEELISRSMKEHRSHRALTQPSELPNAGSFFKNPTGGSAGALIESCGLKGFRKGGAQVSTKHANFLVAHPGAKAQDVYDLMALVQSRVFERSGVVLIPEVRMVGTFDSSHGEVNRG